MPKGFCCMLQALQPPEGILERSLPPEVRPTCRAAKHPSSLCNRPIDAINDVIWPAGCRPDNTRVQMLQSLQLPEDVPARCFPPKAWPHMCDHPIIIPYTSGLLLRPQLHLDCACIHMFQHAAEAQLYIAKLTTLQALSFYATFHVSTVQSKWNRSEALSPE
jgi:hypothetical protein